MIKVLYFNRSFVTIKLLRSSEISGMVIAVARQPLETYSIKIKKAKITYRDKTETAQH